MTLLEALGITHELAVENALERRHVDPELYDEVDRQDEALRLVDDLLTNHADLINSFGVDVSAKEELAAYPLLDDESPTNPQEESHIEQEAPVEAGADSEPEPDITLYYAFAGENHATVLTHYDIGADPKDGDLMMRGEPLRYRLDLWNHSPDGFSWGYGGSGPAQFALAILADHLGDDAMAVRLHQLFKRDYIAAVPKENDFEITSDEIDEWVDAHRREGDLKG